MPPRFSISLPLAVFFLVIYGGYGIWSVREATYGFWYTWNLRILGACILLSAILLARRMSWTRHLLYVLSALTVFSWLYTILYTYFNQPQLFGANTEEVVIGVFITLIPVMGMVGAAVIAHRLLRVPRA